MLLPRRSPQDPERACWSARLLTLALVVGAAALAGCVQDGDDRGPVPATEAISLAEAEAMDWAEDAELIIASGIEAPEEHPATQRPETDEHVVPADEDIGDGSAPMWTVMFYSDTQNNTRSFSVTGDTVDDLEEAEPPSQEPEPMGEWEIDSPEAVSTAMNETSFRETALASQASVAMTLGMLQEQPVWSIVAQDPNHPQATVEVHAVTGEVLDDQAESQDQQQEGGS